MKKSLTSLLAAGLLATTGTVLAADYIAYGYIESVRTNGNQLFIDLYVDESDGDLPNCHNIEGQWDFRTDGSASPLLKETILELSRGSAIGLESSGACAGNVQTIRAVRTYNDRR
jgi:hypothetical protein